LLNSEERDGLRVVLVSVRNPLNIGAAARAMSNFGFARLALVNPYASGFREARSAVGASEVLAGAKQYATLAEAVADCVLVVGTTAVRHRDLQHPLRRLEAGGRLIRAQLGSRPVAILFGSEKFGLSNQDLSHCQWLMRIPTRDANISMNLGQAVAVCLYELVREARLKAQTVRTQPAVSGDVERISSMLLEAMRASGYLRRHPTADPEERLRRLVHRLKLEAPDTIAWLGILRQILWKLKAGNQETRKLGN
jgi:tRNA/rRNA methyltransferase